MAGIIDYINQIRNKFQFLKWIQIVPQESLATKKSALYFVEKNDTEVDAIVIDDLGQKRKLTGGGTTGDYIPLTGTEEGKPVTGLVEMIGKNEGVSASVSGNEFVLTNGTQKVTINYEQINGNNGYIDFSSSENEVVLGTGGQTTIVTSLEELIKNGNRRAFAQLSDVYDSNSYSTDEIKTGGTWIDGKPIYTITQLTTDTAPTVDTMIKSTVVGGTYTEYEYTKLAE